MNLNQLKEFWKAEEQYTFKGWDFSHIDNRMEEEQLPWDYKEIVQSYIEENKVLLDMGTGGGEFLLSLKPTPGKTYATESYPPNIELSQKALTPHGIVVKAVDDDSKIPFEDNYFDIIINRHEAYCISEVKRILKPGGIFITQQVGGRNNKELSKFLLGRYPNTANFDFNLENVLKEAKNTGFSIFKQGEYFPKTYFYDIGALVFFAKIIEWEFPNFSVELCMDKLIELQEQVENLGYVTSEEHRFFFIAIK